MEGLQRRIVAFPVEENRYHRIAGLKGKVIYTDDPGRR